MARTGFVATDWLAQHLADPELRLFDVSVVFKPRPDPAQRTIESGRPAYEREHLPGAGCRSSSADRTSHQRCESTSRHVPGAHTMQRRRVAASAVFCRNEPREPTERGRARGLLLPAVCSVCDGPFPSGSRWCSPRCLPVSSNRQAKAAGVTGSAAPTVAPLEPVIMTWWGCSGSRRTAFPQPSSARPSRRRPARGLPPSRARAYRQMPARPRPVASSSSLAGHRSRASGRPTTLPNASRVRACPGARHPASARRTVTDPEANLRS